MEDGSTELVTVARDEGTISQEGDAFNAANMNDLEDRIAAGFEEINTDLSNIVPSGSTNIFFTFSNKATSGGKYYTNSVYMPKDLSFNISDVEFVGSVGKFASQITVVRSGNYINLTATNSAFAGLTASCVGTIA